MVRWCAVCLVLLLCSCAQPVKDKVQYFSGNVIAEDTLWSGSIVIDGEVEVLRTARLTIAPGTDISFVYKDENRDGLGDGRLVVKGELVAVGSKLQPIRFRSAKENPQPGDWLEIAVDFSKSVHLRYCEIRDSAYTLHAHFTKGLVEDCHIHHNIDGCRIGQAHFTLQHNLIEHNSGKGINFRNSQVKVLNNLIRQNVAGIFLFENDQPITISGNSFSANQYHFRLGDFYTADVALQGNWWGDTDLKAIRKRIYDRQVDPEIGAVSFSPAMNEPKNVGPR